MTAPVTKLPKMEQKCAGCTQDLSKSEYLTCTLCSYKYDLECANIPRDYFKTVMTTDQKITWKCQDCRCKMPKIGNSNTPIRSQIFIHNQQITSPGESGNVTHRKRTTHPNNDSTSSDDLSLLGDTLHSDENKSTMNTNTQSENLLQSLSQVIITRLKENNEAIISELRSTIQTEINKAIAKLTEDFEQKTNYLSKQNDQRKLDLEKVDTKIENLIKENEKLKKEISEIKAKSVTAVTKCTESNSKKIVLYGLTEYSKESEVDLHDRVIKIFQDILHVDLTGYLENMYRLGRNTTNTRPLVVELLSKRMAKYLIKNSPYFQGTRLSISEFLDEDARKQRQLLREEMLQARQKGLHSVIRNNQLYVEGKLINKRNKTYQQNNETNNTNDNIFITQNNIHSNDQHNETTTKPSTENNSFRSHRTTF